MPKFTEDKKRGDVGEQMVKSLLEKNGAKVSIMGGDFPDYDLVVAYPHRVFTAEVKTDFRVADTGNVALELNAINHSKTAAWFYVLMLPQPEIHILDILKVKPLLTNYQSGNYGEHGERNFLVPYQDFVSKFSIRKYEGDTTGKTN